MKVFMEPIKMVFYSEENGVITPLKFQMMSPEKENITVKIDNILLRTEEKLAGNMGEFFSYFKCQLLYYLHITSLLPNECILSFSTGFSKGEVSTVNFFV